MERLYDFEEECVDGLLQTKETDSMQRTDQRIKTTLELVSPYLNCKILISYKMEILKVHVFKLLNSKKNETKEN